MGERAPHERTQTDHEQVARLFDKSRDPEARVRDDDWHPASGIENGADWVALDNCQSVRVRRCWYETLRDER